MKLTGYGFTKQTFGKTNEIELDINDKLASSFCDMRYTGVYKLMGYRYSVQDIVKRYVVKDFYGNLQEYYAPNKTFIRKWYVSRPAYILEIPKKRV